MAKRRYGLGAITYRKDGRWEGRIRLADGSRHSVYARDRLRVITRLREERWQLEYGIPLPARGLLLGVLHQWLEVIRTRVRQRTLDSYELNARRLERELGGVPLTR